MSIEQLVQEVEEVYLKLDEEISEFTKSSSLHCKTGCGKCCLKPDIEATILEFIPFAYHLYKEGKAHQWLENPALSQQLCAILDSNRIGIGHCTSYHSRGLICRLFGFSARLNKYGSRELVTCQVIKTEQPAEFLLAQAATIAQSKPVPLIRDHYMKLHAIDRELSEKFYPINTAIKKAIENVFNYYTYREDPDVVLG